MWIRLRSNRFKKDSLPILEKANLLLVPIWTGIYLNHGLNGHGVVKLSCAGETALTYASLRLAFRTNLLFFLVIQKIRLGLRWIIGQNKHSNEVS